MVIFAISAEGNSILAFTRLFDTTQTTSYY